MATRAGLVVVITATFGACGGSGGRPVDPSGTQGWTWEECGRIPATPEVDTGKSTRFVPDGRALAYTRDGRALLFQPTTPSGPPAILGPLEGSLAFSRDGALVASSTGAAFVIRRIADGTVVRELALPVDGKTPCLETIALSTSGAHLLARGEDGMCLYDLAARRVTARLPFSWGETTFWGDTEELVAITTFAPSVGFTVVRLDPTGAELGRAVVPRDAGVWLSPDGSVAVSVAIPEDDVQECTLWSTSDGAELWSARAHVADSWTRAQPVFSARGDLAVLCAAVVRTADGVRVQDMISGTAHDESIGWVWAGTTTSLAPDGRHLVGYDSGGSLALLELDSERVSHLGGHRSAGVRFLSVSASRNAQIVVSNAADMLVWKIAARFEDSTASRLAAGTPTYPRIEVSADGTSVAVSGDGRLMYDLLAGTRRGVLSQGDLGASRNVCWPELRFSGDGRLLAGVEWDSVVRVRQNTQVQDAVAEVGSGCVRVAISPDSQLLATSRAAVYRLEDGERLVPGGDGSLGSLGALPSGWSDSVEFSPDQTQVLVSSECTGAPSPPFYWDPSSWERPPVCSRVELHATNDGRLLRTLPDNMGRYPSFSPDGTWIVTGGALYHVPTGTVRSLDGEVQASAFTSDGDIIAGDAASNLIRYCRR